MLVIMLKRKMTPLTSDEIKKMRTVGRLAARTLEYAGKFVKPGITTDEIDKIVADFTLTHGATCAPLGYNGFPKSVCTSINNVICHGVPDSTKLKEGDIINVDVTSLLEGFHGDCSATYMVGQVSETARQIVEVARMARDKGIEAIRPGGTTGDIGFAIDKFVTRKGYSTVKEIGGHGIGRTFHDDPFVPSYGKRGHGPQLIPWHCITVEPMVNEGSPEVKEIDIPNSSVKWYETVDGKLSAQFEHTVLVTDTSFEIMTLPD